MRKYPKTLHLPWSPGLQNDDRLLHSFSGFEGREVVVTEKMDGENTTLYHNHLHARSLDSRHHPSRDWVKAFHGWVKFLIPGNMRICGENMYAEHSVRYDDLEDYFLGFGVYTVNSGIDICASWDETMRIFEKFAITLVRTLWRGPWEGFLAYHEYLDASIEPCGMEGYVVRVTDAFLTDDFQQHVAKYVRRDHVQTDQHWMAKAVVPNGLKERN